MNDDQKIKLSALRSTPGLVDIGKTGRAAQSSLSRWSRGNDAQNAVMGDVRDFAFHTDREEAPWWSLTFDEPQHIQYLLIENRRTPRLRHLADHLTIEVETGDGMQTVYDDTRSFGITEEDNALLVALDGAVSVTGIKITAHTQGGYFHLSSVGVFAKAEEADSVVNANPRPVLIANRSDGFGERVKAMLNAMVAARKLSGDFYFSWYGMAESRLIWHDVYPADETFSRNFIESHFKSHREIEAMKAMPFSNAVFAPSAVAGQSYIVSQVLIERQCSQLLPNGVGDTFKLCFNDIEFTPHLEKARAYSNVVDLGGDASSAALHLRAGDIIFGSFRKMSRYHRKACAFPIAESIAMDMQAQGRRLVLFGQDEDFINYLVDRYGAVSSASLARAQDFDSQQQALFDICLMARCNEVICGASGFADLACWIGGISPKNPYRYYDHDKTLRLLKEAGGAPDDPRIADLQKSFAIWLAFILSNRDIADTAEYVALLDRAIELDPENEFFRIVKASSLIHADDPAGAEQILLECAASKKETKELLRVLSRIHLDGTSQLAGQLPYLAKAAEQGYPMAALYVAIIQKALGNTDEAARFGAIWRANKGQIETPLEKHLDAV